MAEGFRIPLSNIHRHGALISPSKLDRIQRASQRPAIPGRDPYLVRNEATEPQRLAFTAAESERKARQQQAKIDGKSARQQQTLADARSHRHEELDEVKTLNKDMLTARVLTMRDRQLSEKLALAKRAKEAEDKMNQALEETRQRALALYADRDRQRSERNRIGGEVLRAQMEEVKERKITEMLEKDREREIIEIERQKALAEEKRVRELRKSRQQQFNRDCQEATAMHETLKSKAKQQADEEEQNLRDYQAAQSRAAEARERELEARRMEKEREIDRIRRTQERAIDLKAERDAMMAERFELQRERKLREREEADMRRSIQLSQNSRADYRRSLNIQEERRRAAAAEGKADFEAQLEASKAAREAEQREQAERREHNCKYGDDLRRELGRLAENRRSQALVKQDEHRFFEEQNQSYVDKIERIRQQKIEQLRAEGVPEKYLYDIVHRRFPLR
jgi:hypothetical protein